MNHPRYEILQDYFEDVLPEDQEESVKRHLLACDQCTGVLRDFAAIETRVLKEPLLAVSHEVRSRIFLSAGAILEEKKSTPTPAKLEEFWEEWKEFRLPELRLPALQLCSLSIALVVLVSVEKERSREEKTYRPLSDDVEVLTYNEPEEKE